VTEQLGGHVASSQGQPTTVPPCLSMFTSSPWCVPGAPPPLPSALTVAYAELFHIFSLLSLATVDVAQQLFPLLKYVITEVLPLSLISSALASSRSVLEPAGTGSIGHRGSFSNFSQKPPLWLHCYAIPIQLADPFPVRYFFSF